MKRTREPDGPARQERKPSRPARKAGGSSQATERLEKIIAGALVLAIVAGLGILVVTLGGKAYRYMLDDERLVVEEIVVEGAIVLSEEEIVALSGIRRQSQMLTLDLRAAAERVGGNPRIAEVVVERRLPRKIVIRVRERLPIGLIQDDGVLKGIDAEGVIVPLIPAREEIKSPVLTGAIRDTAQVILKEALAVIELLRPDLLPLISEVRLDENGGITLLTSGEPMVIRLGRGEMPKKVERLREVLRHFEERGLKKEYVDLRFADVVTRP
jgi:cell division protein FtsQ